MTNLAIAVVVEPDDIAGIWHVIITLTDQLKEAEISLEAEFIVVK